MEKENTGYSKLIAQSPFGVGLQNAWPLKVGERRAYVVHLIRFWKLSFLGLTPVSPADARDES